MKRQLLASIASLILGASAQAAPSYAVLSLVGDKLDIVTYQPTVGSQLDANTHTSVVMPQDELDIAALRSINRALKASVPGAQVALLAASKAEDFDGQENIFSGGRVTLPAEIDAAVHREGATTLLLVTKHHGEARMQAADTKIGSGRVEGLGFYLDGNMNMRDLDTGTRSKGYIAPFVYIDVSLVDLATSKVLRHATITTGRVIQTANNPEGVSAWDALTGAQKVAQLTSMLTEQLDATVPALVSERSAASDAHSDAAAAQR